MGTAVAQLAQLNQVGSVQEGPPPLLIHVPISVGTEKSKQDPPITETTETQLATMGEATLVQ